MKRRQRSDQLMTLVDQLGRLSQTYTGEIPVLE
jgi:hypothetical protein